MSTGCKDIPTHLRKDGVQALTAPLTLLTNRTVSEGSIPAKWKHAIVTPVFKSSSRTDPASQTKLNYHPISLFLDRYFRKNWNEQCIKWPVYDYLQKHKLLSDCQSGFHPLHSTPHQLLSSTSQIHYSIT